MEDRTQVWVVGQVRAIAQTVLGYAVERPQVWELTGVFRTEQGAIAACRDRTYFVMGPVNLGESAPHDTDFDWTPCRYPIEGQEGDSPVPGEAA